VRNLQDEGLSLVEFGQGFFSMGPASAEFLRLLIGRELQHGGNPIATWCASNVSVRKDSAGKEKPDKEQSTEKIDAIVAAVMAVGRMQAGGQGGRSVYESIAGPPPPSARSPAIRPAQHLSVASATVGANSATIGTNSATDVRVSAETAMQHTMV
jgi:Phage Terminase